MDIFTAIETVNIRCVQDIIEEGVDVNILDQVGKTPLLHAIQKGNREILNYLINKGADVNQTDNDGKTSLNYAAKEGNIDFFVFLIGKGADVDQTDNNGRTQLFWASYGGNIEMVKYLTEKGSNVNQSDNKGITPLYNAFDTGHFDILKYLIEKGANVNQTDNQGHSVLLHALMRGCFDVLYFDIFKYLIKNGANVNQTYDKGISFLHYASIIGNQDTVKNLIEEESDVNQSNNEGLVHLHNATMANFDVLKFLIEEGADIKQTNNAGKDSLMYAVIGGNLEIVKYLIEKVGDCSLTKNERIKLLNLATTVGHLGIVKYFIEGANLDETSWCLCIASKKGHIEIVQYLMGMCINGNKSKNPLHYASEEGHLHVVKYLIENGTDVNIRSDLDNNIQTPLHFASDEGHLEVVKYLIENEADINAVDYPDGECSLHYASNKGHLEIVKYLIENGIYVDIKSEFLNTPLHFACKGYLEVVKYLIEIGADMNNTDANGSTMLHYAAGGGHLDMVEYLIQKEAEVNKSNTLDILTSTITTGDTHEPVYNSPNYMRDSERDLAKYKSINHCTPLYDAVESGNVKVVQYLISHGADVNLINGKNKTVLQHAIERYNNLPCLMPINDEENEYLDIVKLLTETEINCSIKPKDMIHFALKGNVMMLRILLQKMLPSEFNVSCDKLSNVNKEDKFDILKLHLSDKMDKILLCRRMIHISYPILQLQEVDRAIKYLEYIQSAKILPLIADSTYYDTMPQMRHIVVMAEENILSVDNYTITDTLLGKGSFGTVKLGVLGGFFGLFIKCNSELSFKVSKVAVKCIDNSLHNVDLRLLVNEIEVCKKMTHQNLVRYIGHKVVIDSDNEHESVYIFTELCKEDCNKYFITNGKVNNCNPATANHHERSVQHYISYAVQLLCGLSYMHSQNCVHKDLKLTNILISHDNKIRITDFGLSDILEKNIEETNEFKGTKVYSAPEVLSSPRRYSPASDIFSISLVLQEMYSGQIYYKVDPFLGANVPTLLKEGVRPSLDDSGSQDEQRIFSIIKSCWNENPCDRLSAEEAKNQLQELLDEIHRRNPDLEVLQQEEVGQDVDRCDEIFMSQALSDTMCLLPKSDLFKSSEASGGIPEPSISRSASSLRDNMSL